MTLDSTLEIYRKNLAALLKDEGRFVLISEREIVGVFDTYEDALSAGYEKIGLRPFLVKKIESADQVQCFSRPISSPCPT
jgi:hypothetical protein